MTIRGLVFDLAGVLLDFRGPESVHALSEGRTTEEEFFRFWSEAKCAHDFTCGKCTPEQFAWHAVRELNLKVSSHKFLAEFRTWLRGPYDGALELLQGLRPRYRVACLSNTNELDVKRFDEELQLQNYFDECFYSNEMGFRKPELTAYLHVIKSLDMPAHEIAFFDDSLKNVGGAAAVGMHARHVTGFRDLMIQLNEIKISS